MQENIALKNAERQRENEERKEPFEDADLSMLILWEMVEGINADLRYDIPLFARRSRCFARELETLYAVVAVFADAYNAFDAAKTSWRATHFKGAPTFWLSGFFVINAPVYSLSFCFFDKSGEM